MLASLTCQIVVLTLITNSFLRIIKCKIVIFIPQLYVKVWCTLSLIFFSTTPANKHLRPKAVTVLICDSDSVTSSERSGPGWGLSAKFLQDLFTRCTGWVLS